MKVMYKGDIYQLMKQHGFAPRLKDVPIDASVLLVYPMDTESNTEISKQESSHDTQYGVMVIKFCDEAHRMFIWDGKDWQRSEFTSSHGVIDYLELKTGSDSVIPAYYNDIMEFFEQDSDFAVKC